jgi:hypothetical protein
MPCNLAALDEATPQSCEVAALGQIPRSFFRHVSISITAYLGNGGALERAQSIAAHESPRTTKLYDRTKDRLTQDEVEDKIMNAPATSWLRPESTRRRHSRRRSDSPL